MRTKKSSFTILEILIAFMILAIAISGIGVQGAKLVRQERFERAMEIISDQIDFAYELLLLYQTDFIMTLQQQENGILCSYSVIGNSETFSKNIARSQLIKGVDSLYLQSEKVQVIQLHFSKDYLTEKIEISFSLTPQKRLFSLKGVLCKSE